MQHAFYAVSESILFMSPSHKSKMMTSQSQ